MTCQHRPSYRAFTLIEILIVVIILGILAAIVIPQFASASREAKTSSLVTTVQTLRGQIALFRLQHNDYLPGVSPVVGGGATFNPTTFWDQLTMYSDGTGVTSAARSSTYDKGPYMQSIPTNPLCPTSSAASTVAEAGTITTNLPAPNATEVGFIYDFQGGGGSGRIWGTDTDGKTPVSQ